MIEKTETNKRKRRMIILIVLGVLLASWFIYRQYFQVKPETTTVVSGEFLPAEKDAQKISDKELKKLAQKAVDRSKFNLMISPEAKIDEQTLQGKLMIKNSIQNNFPINVEIREKHTNKLVYTSGAIQPGYEIKDVTLEQTLTKGEYPSVALFSLYDPETNEKKGQVAAGITLTVE